MIGPVIAAPTRGLAPGCPRATDWLAIMSFVLIQELKSHIPSCVPRPYVDDLTSDVQHDDDDQGVALATAAVTTMVTVVQASW